MFSSLRPAIATFPGTRQTLAVIAMVLVAFLKYPAAGTGQIAVPGTITADAVRFELGRFGFGSISLTARDNSNLTVGYTRIQADTEGDPLPTGVATFRLHQNGALVSEVSFSSTGLISWGRVYAEIGDFVNTGIAIANPNSDAATIDFYFTDEEGNDFGHGQATIETNEQIARFLSEPPFLGPRNLEATFTMTSSLPVSSIALRGRVNERNEFLMAALPVAPIDENSLGYRTIPEFQDGGGWTTRLILVNKSDETRAGEFTLLSPDGQTLPMMLNGVTNSSFTYSLPPNSFRTFQSNGTSPDLVAGSVRIETDLAQSPNPNSGIALHASDGLSAFAIMSRSWNGVTLSQTMVPSKGGFSQSSLVFVESSADFGAGVPGSVETGIVVANAANQTDSFRFELFATDGTYLGRSSTFQVGPRRQISMLLRKIPDLPAISESFQGVLRVFAYGHLFSPTPEIVVSGFRMRYNERGDLLASATTESIEQSNRSPELLLPHLAAGAGYETQFVLLHAGDSTPTTGTVSFFDQAGSPVDLTLEPAQPVD